MSEYEQLTRRLESGEGIEGADAARYMELQEARRTDAIARELSECRTEVEAWQVRFRNADHHERGLLIREVPDAMPDAEYWRAVAGAWQDCERQPHSPADWRALFTANRGSREALMNDDERAQLLALPERVEIHRGWGRHSVGPAGLSWTLDPERAEWFARRQELIEGVGIVTTGRVLRKRIIALLEARNEQEVLVFPKYVYDRSMRVVRAEEAS